MIDTRDDDRLVSVAVKVRPDLVHFDVDDDTERAKREVEAEAVAYIVGRYCGLDTSGSAFYLASWESDDADVVRERLGRISRTSTEIIALLEE